MLITRVQTRGVYALALRVLLLDFFSDFLSFLSHPDSAYNSQIIYFCSEMLKL